jgi:hypothetical protein
MSSILFKKIAAARMGLRVAVNCWSSSIPTEATSSESSARAKRLEMKKASTKKDDQHISELTREQLGRGVRGKYFKRMAESSNVVVLRPEISKAFPTSRAVNEALAGLLALTQQTNRLTSRKSGAK